MRNPDLVKFSFSSTYEGITVTNKANTFKWFFHGGQFVVINKMQAQDRYEISLDCIRMTLTPEEKDALVNHLNATGCSYHIYGNGSW